MVFLGSVKMDKSKRVTLIKEVSEVLQVTEKDHLMFYIEDGEIVIRKYIPDSPKINGKEKNAQFWEWARKRQIEIELTDDVDERSVMQEDLDEKKSVIRSGEEYGEGVFVNEKVLKKSKEA